MDFGDYRADSGQCFTMMQVTPSTVTTSGDREQVFKNITASRWFISVLTTTSHDVAEKYRAFEVATEVSSACISKAQLYE